MVTSQPVCLSKGTLSLVNELVQCCAWSAAAEMTIAIHSHHNTVRSIEMMCVFLGCSLVVYSNLSEPLSVTVRTLSIAAVNVAAPSLLLNDVNQFANGWNKRVSVLSYQLFNARLEHGLWCCIELTHPSGMQLFDVFVASTPVINESLKGAVDAART
jgi:hypothetical protein